MFLTKMELDVKKRSTLFLISSAERLHAMVEGAFSDNSRKLWRLDVVDGHYYILILSENRPDFSRASKNYAPDGAIWQCKDYSPLFNRIENGTKWRFRLTANPTKSVFKKGKRGTVCACGCVSEQEEWLLKQAEKSGFSLQAGDFQVVYDEWLNFKKGFNEKFQVSLRSVTFEGVLEIVEADLFKASMFEGFGRGKAYGQGLLTIVKI